MEFHGEKKKKKINGVPWTFHGLSTDFPRTFHVLSMGLHGISFRLQGTLSLVCQFINI
jgi:hypothetical protein